MQFPQTATLHSSDQRTRKSRLQQIYRRAPDAEGRFWYSVITTGVYCRPTCPSRRALPSNIRLHETLEEARATGFRPCARCNPESPSQQARHASMIGRACEIIDRNETGSVSPAALASAVGLSRSQFYRLFRRVTGTTPCEYAARTKPTQSSGSRGGSLVQPGDSSSGFARQARSIPVRVPKSATQ